MLCQTPCHELQGADPVSLTVLLNPRVFIVCLLPPPVLCVSVAIPSISNMALMEVLKPQACLIKMTVHYNLFSHNLFTNVPL
jgi:hypothetical protein